MSYSPGQVAGLRALREKAIVRQVALPDNLRPEMLAKELNVTLSGLSTLLGLNAATCYKLPRNPRTYVEALKRAGLWPEGQETPEGQ